MVLIFVFDNLLLFSLVPLLMSVAGLEKLSLSATIRRIVWRVLTHPFNVATAIGIAASYLHLRLPQAADQMVTWLSGAAAPCALFILGVTVALRPLRRIPADVPTSSFIKLILHPLAGLGGAVGRRRFRAGLDLCGHHHGGAAAGPEHLRHLDPVQCRASSAPPPASSSGRWPRW